MTSIRRLPEWEEKPGLRWRWAKCGNGRVLEVCEGLAAKTFRKVTGCSVTVERLGAWAALLAQTEETYARRFTRFPTPSERGPE